MRMYKAEWTITWSTGGSTTGVSPLFKDKSSAEAVLSATKSHYAIPIISGDCKFDGKIVESMSEGTV